MTGRFVRALLLVATSGMAANLPRFEAMIAGIQSVGAMATDARGNTYLTGQAAGLVTTPGAYQSRNNGGTCYGSANGFPIPLTCHNSYVMKLDATGAVVFATYLGGTGDAESTAIVVDADENVYVAGTLSGDFGFPTTPSAAFTSGDGFLAKLSASGTNLVYSTVIYAAPAAIALAGAGNLYFTGWGNASFPATLGAYQATYPAIPNALDLRAVAGKLNASGSALVYGTYLSGAEGPSQGAGIAVDTAGNALVAGTNLGADGAVGDLNVFLAKLSPDGSSLISRTLFGSALVATMKVSASGDIYIGCLTAAPGFPVTPGGFGMAPPADLPSGVYPSFLLHVRADSSSLLNSLYLPFNLSQTAGLEVDAVGNAYVVGTIFTGPSLQASVGAYQSAFGGGTADVFVAKITPGGQIAGATYLGGLLDDEARGIAAQRDGSVVVVRVSAADSPAPAAPGTGSFVTNFFPAITIENSASYIANTAVPGELVSLQGYGIGPAAGVASSPKSALGGVQVYFDNFAAPISYAQAGQVNAQAPWEIAGQTTTQIRILYNGVEAGSAVVPVAAALPGVFYIDNSDGSHNSPSNPARAGDFVMVYGTGGGAMSPAGITGAGWPLAPLSYLTQPVSVTVGGEAAGVLYPGSAPTLSSGYFQINVQLPADLTAAQFLNVTVGGMTSAPAAIAVQ